MKILFISSNTDSNFNIIPFIKRQEDSIRKNGVIVDHFLINQGGILGYLKHVIRLKKHLNKHRYQILHAHYSLAGWVAFFASPTSLIFVSYMGSDVYGFVNEKGKRVLKGYIEVLASKLLQPFITKIIVKSKNLEDYIYLKYKSTIIPNGVDFENFRPRNKKTMRKMLNLPQDKKLIMFLGNPKESRKNISLVKDAVSVLNDKDIKLIYPYPVTPEKVQYYLNAGDTLVLSSYLEGSPNVIKEGMASNVPIVSTEVGDVAEIISYVSGCFLCSFDPTDMAEKIKSALTYTQGTNARKKIKHLEINTIARKIIALYIKELKKRNISF